MLKLIAVTNHALCKQNYWDHMEQIAASDIDSIILREKNLDEEEYTNYAKKMQRLCNLHQKQCILSQLKIQIVKMVNSEIPTPSPNHPSSIRQTGQ